MLLSLLPRISSHAATVFTASRTQPRPIRSFHPRIVGSAFQSGKWTNVTSIVVLALPIFIHMKCVSTFLAFLLPFFPLFPSMCDENSTNRRNVNIGKCASVETKFFSALCVSRRLSIVFEIRFIYSVYRIVSFFFFFLTTFTCRLLSVIVHYATTTNLRHELNQAVNGGDIVNCSITMNESFQVVKRSKIIPLYARN